MNNKEILAMLAEKGVEQSVIDELAASMKASRRTVSASSERCKQVLAVLRQNAADGIAVADIAEILGITAKNVSSYLSYLRRQGFEIWTLDGRKFLKEAEAAEAAETAEVVEEEKEDLE